MCDMYLNLNLYLNRLLTIQELNVNKHSQIIEDVEIQLTTLSYSMTKTIPSELEKALGTTASAGTGEDAGSPSRMQTRNTFDNALKRKEDDSRQSPRKGKKVKQISDEQNPGLDSSSESSFLAGERIGTAVFMWNEQLAELLSKMDCPLKSVGEEVLKEVRFPNRLVVTDGFVKMAGALEADLKERDVLLFGPQCVGKSSFALLYAANAIISEKEKYTKAVYLVCYCSITQQSKNIRDLTKPVHELYKTAIADKIRFELNGRKTEQKLLFIVDQIWMESISIMNQSIFNTAKIGKEDNLDLLLVSSGHHFPSGEDDIIVNIQEVESEMLIKYVDFSLVSSDRKWVSNVPGRFPGIESVPPKYCLFLSEGGNDFRFHPDGLSLQKQCDTSIIRSHLAEFLEPFICKITPPYSEDGDLNISSVLQAWLHRQDKASLKISGLIFSLADTKVLVSSQSEQPMESLTYMDWHKNFELRFILSPAAQLYLYNLMLNLNLKEELCSIMSRMMLEGNTINENLYERFCFVKMHLFLPSIALERISLKDVFTPMYQLFNPGNPAISHYYLVKQELHEIQCPLKEKDHSVVLMAHSDSIRGSYPGYDFLVSNEHHRRDPETNTCSRKIMKLEVLQVSCAKEKKPTTMQTQLNRILLNLKEANSIEPIDAMRLRVRYITQSKIDISRFQKSFTIDDWTKDKDTKATIDIDIVYSFQDY